MNRIKILEGLRLDNVSIVFGRGESALLAVHDFSLSVRDTEFLCLLGPSGCGKSTLLKTMAKLEPCTAGSVTIGTDDEDHPDAVMVWQEHTLVQWRKIKDNVAFGLELRGVPTKERYKAAQKALSELGIGAFAEYYPRQLSGGMRQRAGIARALVVDPRILLMDEPFAAVDAQTRRILQEQALDLCQRLGKTVVFVTHSIEEALLLGDRVVVMTARPGRIRDIVEVPFPRPRNPEIRRLPEFHDVEERIWEMLRGEAARTEVGV